MSIGPYRGARRRSTKDAVVNASENVINALGANFRFQKLKWYFSAESAIGLSQPSSRSFIDSKCLHRVSCNSEKTEDLVRLARSELPLFFSAGQGSIRQTQRCSHLSPRQTEPIQHGFKRCIRKTGADDFVKI